MSPGLGQFVAIFVIVTGGIRLKSQAQEVALLGSEFPPKLKLKIIDDCFDVPHTPPR